MSDLIRPVRFADELFSDTGALRRAFSDPVHSFGPFLYLPVVHRGEDATALCAERTVSACRKDGYAGIVPYYPSEGESRPFEDEYLPALNAVYDACASYGMMSAYFDDPIVMSSFMAAHPDKAPEFQCHILKNYEHECVAGETFTRALTPDETLMSLSAVEIDTGEILDLRSCITEEHRIVWQVPDGNWILHRYVCERDPNAVQINMLHYDTCVRYFAETCRPLLDSLPDDARGSIRMMICRNVQYGGKNRRMWSEHFNEEFQRRYGFDPAPYYPCLFQDLGPASLHYRALFMSCRAAMLTDGYMRAAADFCAARGMFATGFAIESKATACSWLFGDGQLLHKYSYAPGISMPFSYMYGLNGVKVASGAADGFDCGLVSADMFRRYPRLNEDTLYRESINVFVRGVNMEMVHVGRDREDALQAPDPDQSGLLALFTHNRAAEDYTDFCSRAQLLLRGGRHVCDIAVLYPIHSLHAQTYLYDFSQSGFEYPSTPEDADYMTDMNNLLTYACTDAEFLHPSVLTDSCYSEDGCLYRNTGEHGGRFYTVILPGCDVISLYALRMLAGFFACGGRIIATGCLPRHAFELNAPIRCSGQENAPYDEEVRALCERIFGSAAVERHTFSDIYENRSAAGGAAYFIPSTRTDADGISVVPAAQLAGVLEQLGYPPDVYFVDPPKIEYSGVLGYNLPTFQKVGVGEKLLHSGSVGCLHKKNALCDVYFLSNTTDAPYQNDILLRGIHQAEEWNPYRGKTHKIPHEFVRFRGECYTRIRPTLSPGSCTFIISPNANDPLRAVESETLTEYVPGEYAEGTEL